MYNFIISKTKIINNKCLLHFLEKLGKSVGELCTHIKTKKKEEGDSSFLSSCKTYSKMRVCVYVYYIYTHTYNRK